MKTYFITEKQSHKDCWEDAIKNGHNKILIIEGNQIFLKDWESKIESFSQDCECLLLSCNGIISWGEEGFRQAKNMYQHSCYMLQGEGIKKYLDMSPQDKLKQLQIDDKTYFHFPFLSIEERNDFTFHWMENNYFPKYIHLYDRIQLTLSTGFYIMNSKFPVDKYLEWIDNMLSNVNNYYLVVYTNEETKKYLIKYDVNPNIKFVIKEFEEFYFYKYRYLWEENQKILKHASHLDWRLNMLWSEKLPFVQQTIREQYFQTKWYGWCDIGYFRNRLNNINANWRDTPMSELKMWPRKLPDTDKIVYNLVFPILDELSKMEFIPEGKMHIGGGFFLIKKDKINWWLETYEKRLCQYFMKVPVPDDQAVIADCIIKNRDQFELIHQENWDYDKWFYFQRKLI